MAKRKRRRAHHFTRYFFPHRDNGYKPQIFAFSSVAVLLVGLALLQGASFLTAHVLFTSDFFASVLPSALISLTNGDRAQNNLGGLTEDPLLDAAAQLKANDMAAKGYFAHVSPEGHDPWYWFQQVGYHYVYAGENLAVNFNDSQDVETAWMNSPTHRANIVKPQYTKIGIATAQGTYKGKDVTFVAQLFASEPGAPTAVAPVVPIAKNNAPAQVATAGTAQPVKVAVNTAPTPTRVLGESTAPAAVAAPAVVAVTSPNHTLIYILEALALIIAVLLATAIVVKIRIQYIEIIGGGLLLLVAILAFLYWNASQLGHTEVPTDTQSASIEAAFSW